MRNSNHQLLHLSLTASLMRHRRRSIRKRPSIDMRGNERLPYRKSTPTGLIRLRLSITREFGSGSRKPTLPLHPKGPTEKESLRFSLTYSSH